MNFLIFASLEYEKQYNILHESIKQFYPNDFVLCRVTPETKGDGYIPGMAKERLKKALERLESGWDHVVVLGADCELKGRLTEIEDLLWKDNKDIIIVSHVMNPTNNREQMAQLYRTGHANADIMCFTNTRDGKECLRWLISVTEGQESGIFYEQTWLSSVPFLFSHVAILRDIRYNVGYWTDPETVHYNDVKLMQYSGIDLENPKKMSKYNNYGDATGDLLKLYQEYNEKMK